MMRVGMRRIGISLGGIGLAIGVAIAASLALGTNAGAASGDDRAKLAADLATKLAGSFKGSVIPKSDQKRTEKCLAEAMVADIPEADAGKLVEIYEKRSAGDPALVKRWLTIEKKSAPARNAQVMAQVQKLCPDLGPYLERVL